MAMTWGTPAPQPATATNFPITREDGSLDWSPVVTDPNYDPSAILGNATHPLHVAWLAERDTILQQWANAKDWLARAKESEAELRRQVQSFAFGPKPREGMNNQDLNGGYVLKFGAKLNYGFKASNEEIDKAEDKVAAIGPRAQVIFERLVTWKPDFSKTEYNKLDASDPTDKAIKDIIDPLIEIKPGSGTLEIKEPKAKLNNQ